MEKFVFLRGSRALSETLFGRAAKRAAKKVAGQRGATRMDGGMNCPKCGNPMAKKSDKRPGKGVNEDNGLAVNGYNGLAVNEYDFDIEYWKCPVCSVSSHISEG